MKQRLLFYEIVELIEHKNAIVVAGMRQVGKTTLLKQVFAHIGAKPKLWFDFDNPLDQKIFEDIEYRNIYARLREMVAIPEGGRLNVFIDEIQNFPEITKVIKYLIDHFGVKFFVTGSSNFYLKNIFPESLSGRKFLYDLPPLTFGEYLYFHDKLDLGAARASRDPALFHGGQTIAQFKAREVEYAQYLRYGGFPEVVLSQGEA
jgi:predicted AAA+ superfamily ATPase